MDVYRQCSNEYDAIYGQLTEKYGMLCLQFTNPFWSPGRCKIRLKNLGHEMVDIDAVAYSIQIAFRQEGVFHLNSRSVLPLSNYSTSSYVKSSVP